MAEVRRLPTKLRAVQSSGPSLDFKLMEADRAQQMGNHNLVLDCLLDAIWIMHKGTHEQLGDDRVRQHLRKLGGHEYLPPEAA
jgi:hypothetical protein